MNVGPSQTADSNLEWLTLVGISGSISYTGCPGVIGVEEYLSETVFLNAGANYTVNLQFGTCSQYNFAGVGEAWIDFNGNYIFEPSESIGTWQDTPPSPASAFNFTVPMSALLGQSRMRVVQHENGTLPINPCGTFTWGSVTEFSVYISSGIDCSSYVGDDSSDPRVVSALPYNESHNSAVCYTSVNSVYPSPDVYYQVNTTGIDALDVSLCGSSFDTFLTVTDDQGNAIAINDDGCGTSSELSVDVSNHNSVFVLVEGWGNFSGAYDLAFNEGTLSTISLNKTEFKVFPNPSAGTFTVNTFSGTIDILDQQAKNIRSLQYEEGETISIEDLSEGIYYLILSNDESYGIQKLIKL